MKWKYPSLWQGCVAAYRTDRPSGAFLRDRAGAFHSVAASNIGHENWQGGALDFTIADDEYFELPALGISGDWTASAWVLTRTSAPNIQYFIGTEGNGGLYVEYTTDSNGWGFFDGSSTFSGTDLNENRFYHLCVTKQTVGGTTTYALFLNGIADGGGTGISRTFSDPHIGSRPGGAFRLEGQMKDIRFYNRRLHQSQIALLAKRPHIAYERAFEPALFVEEAAAGKGRLLKSTLLRGGILSGRLVG